MTKEILKIYVKIDSTLHINGNTREINMIHFSGYAKSKYFQGEILPGGIDFQQCTSDGIMHLSARYALKGTDILGEPCNIFIENNGEVNENGEINTIPIITTDSKALAWMEKENLSGNISSENEFIIIHIYSLGH